MFDAIRRRLDLTLVRNVYAVAQTPEVLLRSADALIDIWDLIGCYYDGEKTRGEVDAATDKIGDTASEIYTMLVTRPIVEGEGKQIYQSDVDAVSNYFREERRVWKWINDLRFRKGLAIKMRREWTSEDTLKGLKRFTGKDKVVEDEDRE